MKYLSAAERRLIVVATIVGLVLAGIGVNMLVTVGDRLLSPRDRVAVSIVSTYTEPNRVHDAFGVVVVRRDGNAQQRAESWELYQRFDHPFDAEADVSSFRGRVWAVRDGDQTFAVGAPLWWDITEGGFLTVLGLSILITWAVALVRIHRRRATVRPGVQQAEIMDHWFRPSPPTVRHVAEPGVTIAHVDWQLPGREWSDVRVQVGRRSRRAARAAAGGSASGLRVFCLGRRVVAYLSDRDDNSLDAQERVPMLVGRVRAEPTGLNITGRIRRSQPTVWFWLVLPLMIALCVNGATLLLIAFGAIDPSSIPDWARLLGIGSILVPLAIASLKVLPRLGNRTVHSLTCAVPLPPDSRLIYPGDIARLRRAMEARFVA